MGHEAWRQPPLKVGIWDNEKELDQKVRVISALCSTLFNYFHLIRSFPTLSRCPQKLRLLTSREPAAADEKAQESRAGSVEQLATEVSAAPSVPADGFADVTAGDTVVSAPAPPAVPRAVSAPVSKEVKSEEETQRAMTAKASWSRKVQNVVVDETWCSFGLMY